MQDFERKRNLRYICSMVSEKRALCHSYEYCY